MHIQYYNQPYHLGSILLGTGLLAFCVCLPISFCDTSLHVHVCINKLLVRSRLSSFSKDGHPRRSVVSNSQTASRPLLSLPKYSLIFLWLVCLTLFSFFPSKCKRKIAVWLRETSRSAHSLLLMKLSRGAVEQP